MTYTKRYEVLEAAANWMRVCEAAGVEARCKVNYGTYAFVKDCAFKDAPSSYEFPLALLEGKEVWVGSELYSTFFGRTFVVTSCDINPSGDIILCKEPFGRTYIGSCSWNSPKPATSIGEAMNSQQMMEEIIR